MRELWRELWFNVTVFVLGVGIGTNLGVLVMAACCASSGKPLGDSKRGKSPERELQKQIVAWLRSRGWYARVLSTQKAMPAQLAGLPDVMAWKGSVNLMIEVKAPTGKLRPKQIEFYMDLCKVLEPGTPHIEYVTAYHLAQVQDAVTILELGGYA